MEQISKYHIYKVLPSGGYGVNYVVYIDDPRARLCLKKIVAPLDESEALRAKKLLAEIRSPFLTSFSDCFVDIDSELVLVSEYCTGGSLKDYIAHTQLTNEEIWEVITQIILGMKYLHNRGIVHRDLNLNNILILSHEPGLRVKVADFYSSSVFGIFPEGLFGTYSYLSPEVLLGQTPSTASDMWAFGIVLFYLTQNKFPFSSEQEILVGSLKFDNHNCEVTPLIVKLLSQDPSLRPSSFELASHPRIRAVIEEHRKIWR
ncbi:hypothetical protein RCL1_001297 [Eukaryota sp. TZLM3-RCL]